MRAAAILTLCAAASGGVPAAAVAAPAPSDIVNESIPLSAAEPAAFLDVLTRARCVPDEIQGILANPAGRALFVRGTVRAIRTFKNALSVVDVPVQILGEGKGQAKVRPFQGRPEDLRKSILGLPDAGAATVAGGELTLEGSLAWIQRSLGLVMQTEVGEAPRVMLTTAAGVTVRVRGEAVTPGPDTVSLPADAPVQITVPSAPDLTVSAGHTEYDVRGKRYVLTGRVTLTGTSGFRLETLGVRITLTGLLPRDERRISLDPEPAQKADE